MPDASGATAAVAGAPNWSRREREEERDRGGEAGKDRRLAHEREGVAGSGDEDPAPDDVAGAR
jgi:hypothetical protein